jgi:hypothetical protein
MQLKKCLKIQLTFGKKFVVGHGMLLIQGFFIIFLKNILKKFRSIFIENFTCFNLEDKQESSEQTQFCKKRNFKNKKAKDREEHFEGLLALVPLVDMLNHCSDAQVFI